nr:MAG TPA: hypothetical protein [Caudoviricetes sp.]
MMPFSLFESPPNRFTAISIAIILNPLIAFSHYEMSNFICFFF